MRFFQTTILSLFLAMFIYTCNTPDVDTDIDLDVDADYALDELVDKEVYAEGMIVDCRYYKGARTTRILINQAEYSSPENIDLSMVG